AAVAGGGEGERPAGGGGSGRRELGLVQDEGLGPDAVGGVPPVAPHVGSHGHQDLADADVVGGGARHRQLAVGVGDGGVVGRCGDGGGGCGARPAAETVGVEEPVGAADEDAALG